MKFRYFIGAILLGLGLTAACENEKPDVLSEIKVSESYLSIGVEGGSAQLQFTASDAWQIDPASLGDWLTAAPMSGAAGEANVKLSAEATTATRTAEVKINCGGKTQFINVIQYAQKTEPVPITVAEALALIKTIDKGDGQSYYMDGEYCVKGIVCKITEISTQYGNATYFLSDDGKFSTDNTLQVYRGLWMNGGAFTKGDEFAIGDELTIVGQLMSYKGTPETAEKTAYVLSIKKSLISVDDFSFEKLPAADTTFNMVVTAKESPLLIFSDSDWLQVADVDKDGSYILHADENVRTAERTATISISGPTARKTVSITQKGVEATGSLVSDIIAAADNDLVQTIADKTTCVAKTTKGIVVSDGAEAIYVYGDKVADVKIGDNVRIAAKKTTYNGVPELTDISDVFVDSEGNAVSYPEAKDITPEAATYAAAKAEYVKIIGTLSINKDKGYYNLALDDFADGTKMGSIVYPVAELNANSFDGKKITVTGYFNGISGKGVYINVIATKIAEYVDNPKGTVTNPYSPSDVIAILSSGNAIEGNVYIKGIVSQTTKYNYGPTYNTASFWISDDGTYYNDLTKDFEAYSIYWLGGSIEAPTPAADIKGNFAIGDEVVLYGAVTAFTKDGKTTYETASKKAKIYSINKAVTDANGLGNKDYPFNTAGAFTYIDVTQEEIAAAKAEGLSGDALPKVKDVYVKGKVSKVEYSFEKNAGSEKNDGMATFWTSDDGTFANDKTKDFEAYGVYYLGGRKWVKGQDTDVAVGDEVILFGQLTKYTSSSGSTTYETSSKKAYVYSHNGKTE